MKKLSSRKFLVTVGIIVISTACLLGGIFEPSHWIDVVKYTAGIYLGAKAVEEGLKKIPVGEKVSEELNNEKQSN